MTVKFQYTHPPTPIPFSLCSNYWFFCCCFLFFFNLRSPRPHHLCKSCVIPDPWSKCLLVSQHKFCPQRPNGPASAGWDRVIKVWILKGEKSHATCISIPFLLLSERIWNPEIRLMPEEFHPRHKHTGLSKSSWAQKFNRWTSQIFSDESEDFWPTWVKTCLKLGKVRFSCWPSNFNFLHLVNSVFRVCLTEYIPSQSSEGREGHQASRSRLSLVCWLTIITPRAYLSWKQMPSEKCEIKKMECRPEWVTTACTCPTHESNGWRWEASVIKMRGWDRVKVWILKCKKSH